MTANFCFRLEIVYLEIFFFNLFPFWHGIALLFCAFFLRKCKLLCLVYAKLKLFVLPPAVISHIACLFLEPLLDAGMDTVFPLLLFSNFQIYLLQKGCMVLHNNIDYLRQLLCTSLLWTLFRYRLSLLANASMDGTWEFLFDWLRMSEATLPQKEFLIGFSVSSVFGMMLLSFNSGWFMKNLVIYSLNSCRFRGFSLSKCVLSYRSIDDS